MVWHASWSITGDILAVSGGDNKVSHLKRLQDRSVCTMWVVDPMFWDYHNYYDWKLFVTMVQF